MDKHKEHMDQIYLTRRNLQTLLNKLDRKKAGEETERTIVKCDYLHQRYAQTMEECRVTAVEDEEYYIDRPAGMVYHKDVPRST